MKKRFRKLIPVGLTFLMLAGMLPDTALITHAGQINVRYLDRTWNVSEQRVIETEKYESHDATELYSDIRDMEDGKWYFTGHSYTYHDLTIYDRVRVHGNVSLILNDNDTVNFSRELTFPRAAR